MSAQVGDDAYQLSLLPSVDSMASSDLTQFPLSSLAHSRSATTWEDDVSDAQHASSSATRSSEQSTGSSASTGAPSRNANQHNVTLEQKKQDLFHRCPVSLSLSNISSFLASSKPFSLSL